MPKHALVSDDSIKKERRLISPGRRVVRVAIVFGTAFALCVCSLYLPASASQDFKGASANAAGIGHKQKKHHQKRQSKPKPPPPPLTVCDHNGHRIVQDSSGTAYQIRNPYWHGKHTLCIHNNKADTNFSVTAKPGYNTGGRVVAFPDIFRGCIWHLCSPDAKIPIQVSNIKNLSTTWHTKEHAAGTWDATYDIWFGKHKSITGQSDGAELMIFLNENGLCCAIQKGAPAVKVSGRKYRFSHWTTRSDKYGVSWNYLQFRMKRTTWNVDDLNLMPFIHKAMKEGLIKRSWWMENVEAGFELWSGGRGLRTTKFNVDVTPKRERYLLYEGRDAYPTPDKHYRPAPPTKRILQGA